MKALRVCLVGVSLLALCLAGPTVTAKGKDKDKDKTPGRITVSFGTGNNNSQAGNTPNHHIIPQEFKVRITKAKKLDGTVVVVPATVNFIVAGFHWPWVYQPDVTLQEVEDHIPPTPPVTTPPTPTPTFVNYTVNALGENRVFAKGIDPGTPPTFANANVNPSGVQNRNDTFAFSTPGRYLVICNVRGHFIDGMYAWIRVVTDDEDDK